MQTHRRSTLSSHLAIHPYFSFGRYFTTLSPSTIQARSLKVVHRKLMIVHPAISPSLAPLPPQYPPQQVIYPFSLFHLQKERHGRCHSPLRLSRRRFSHRKRLHCLKETRPMPHPYQPAAKRRGKERRGLSIRLGRIISESMVLEVSV